MKRNLIALTVLAIVGTGCATQQAAEPSPTPATTTAAPTTTTTTTTTIPPTTTTTTTIPPTTTTTIPAPPPVCDMTEEDILAEGNVAERQEQVGTDPDGDWGPASRRAHKNTCAPVNAMSPPAVVLTPQENKFRVSGWTPVDGATRYEFRIGFSNPPEYGETQPLELNSVHHIDAGRYRVQYRSCSELGCSDVWSDARILVVKEPYVAPKNIRRRPSPTTTTAGTGLSGRELIQLAQGFYPGLSDYGVDELIGLARGVCGDLNSGRSVEHIVIVLTAFVSDAYSIGGLAAAAVEGYCPQHRAALNQFSNAY